jgi:hypothetical protein
MSGGPIVQCAIAADSIRCQLMGVVHGGNLIQGAYGVFFKGLIANRDQ